MDTETAATFRTLPLAALRERTGVKWNYYPEDVLPCWVAEMDLPLAEPVKRALVEQIEANDLGYVLPAGYPGLREAVAKRLTERHDYPTAPEDLRLLGTTGAGLNIAVRAFTEPGDRVLLLTPLYPPFKNAIVGAERVAVEVELKEGPEGYGLPLAELEAAVQPGTSMLMLCNPQNPVGRVFTREELKQLANFAERHDLLIVSDDLHADILFDGKHIPIASLSESVAQRTVTLYGPTKAFNIPGLKISFAISQNHELLDKMDAISGGMAAAPNLMAQRATVAAYTEGGAWLEEVTDYLRANRDYFLEQVRERMPRVKVRAPEATYLAWLDLREFDLGEKPAETLAEQAKIGVNDGSEYGAGGAGFVRFNFATSREVLDEALRRLETLLK